MSKYEPSKIESKWQKRWDDEEIYRVNLSKENKYYVLAEFAYPSGDLHVGHWFTFVGADIYARYKRMQGFNVFFPNGFDSFGLPAEGAAIKRNIHPQDWTESNIIRMKQQFKTIGASFDFYGDLATHRPIYYKWNQWIFLKLVEKDLAYQGKYLANWCPFDQTVLANEAIENGKCWRCGSVVVQKEVTQWFFRITEYADRLLWPRNPSIQWPISVREAQNSWIGKSEGMIIDFPLLNHPEEITVFTSYPETIYGVTYMVLAPEHKLVSKIVTDEYKKSVSDYIEKTQKKTELERKESEKDKTGVFTGAYCINPVSGQKVPIWIADYVIASYGTGAVMGVPSSDIRDFQFASKYSLEVIRVIGNSRNDLSEVKSVDDVLVQGFLVNSDLFSGMSTPDPARESIMKFLEKNNYGKRSIQYHLHDWSISRQRYWGTPIPIIHCPECGTVPVPEEDLPVILPYEVDYTPKGKSPLESNESWMIVNCPKCGGTAKRDPDTMDTFVDSSWYFFRYLNPELDTVIFKKNLAEKIMPVDIYFGGAEHTLGHTLYSRFITKFFHDLGLINLEEYAKRRVNHGIVLGPDGQKMSKSRGNVVNPDDEVKKYGSDAVRVHVAFFIPYDGVGSWISDRIWGPFRFLERVWDLSGKVSDTELETEDEIIMNNTIKKVGDDIESVKFNTAIAALMEWLNYLTRRNSITQEEYLTLLKLLSPFAPHLTEELWHNFGKPFSIHLQPWPNYNSGKMESDSVTIVIQVNGKVRDNINLQRDNFDKELLIEKVKSLGNVQKFINGKPIKNYIYIPNKLLNIVV